MLGKAGLSRLSLTSKRAPSPGWVCPTCRSRRIVRAVGQRHSSTAASRPDKPYYVTSPIFYVNAAPHIGHLYTLILTDVLKRWHALLGKRSILCTGTDEHGMKIQRAAAKAGSEPRPFCDEMHQPFKKLAQAANVDWDHFIRTSDADHRYTVEHVWLVLMEWGWIYEKKHQGWYSVSDETFYPESTVQLAIDPATGRKFMASRETGKEVEWTSETNFHFRMSRLRDALLDFYKENPKWIVPETRMKEVVAEVEAGLQDLSISRPRDRLSWGIPCPGEPDQTIYVWVDALINYLTKAKYPMLPPGEEHKGGWPADCHVIGKDIVRFHAIYWPALLMALKLPLPRRILSHAHWTLGKQKMSKSTGMVVNPFFAISRFGVDCMRWYLVLDGGIKDDSAYDNSFIIDRYKKGLQGGLGNLVSRVTKGRAWSVRRAVQNHGESTTEQLDQDFRACLQRLPASTMGDMEDLNSGDALAKIMNVIYDTNAYLQHTAPWDLKEKKDQKRLDQIIYLCAESIRICGILLQPFMPDHMFKLLDMLGVDDEARYFVNTQYGSDSNYGTPKCSMEGPDGVLFSPLTSHN